MADASPPDADRWQVIAVDPKVVAAQIAGVSQGFLVFDDTGTEWTRDGERYTVRHMPNRFVYSRDQNAATAPFFTVTLGPEERAAPFAPGEVRSESRALPAGEAEGSWATPRDSGPAGVAGFLVTIDGRPAPQSLVPAPAAPGDRVVMHLRGSAFADLPRKGVPIEVFYLPLHENWPTPIEPNYNGDYWADRAFTPEYRRAFIAASRQFAAHLDGHGWGGTLFQCFFNGKNDYKRNGWSRASSPWLLDEPAGFQDFWALRYFGAAFHEGVKQAGPEKARLVYRCDISRPQWQRDALDGLLDYNVVGSAMRGYRRIVLDRKASEGQVVVEYGSSNAVEESNVQPLAWAIDAWSLGIDGVLPWQTVGRGNSWNTADARALFYPGGADKPPVPSVRLKAFRRGEQDVEYLTLLIKATGEPRRAVGQRVREALQLAGERGASGLAAVEDAGTVRYGELRPKDVWALRIRLGGALSGLHPTPERQLVDFRTPARDPSKLGPREVDASR
jgi:hypothetical protein